MSSDCQIRPARPSDAPVIADFNARLAWETEHLRLDPCTVAAGVEAILQDPAKGLYFLAESRGAVIGQCSVTGEWSDWRNGLFWWLQSVYIDQAHRGRGVFRLLFEHVRRTALATGAIGLRLYVEQENLAAQDTYRKVGMNRTRYEVFEMAFGANPSG